MMDSRAIFRMDIGFYNRGPWEILWNEPISEQAEPSEALRAAKEVTGHFFQWISAVCDVNPA